MSAVEQKVLLYPREREKREGETKANEYVEYLSQKIHGNAQTKTCVPLNKDAFQDCYEENAKI